MEPDGRIPRILQELREERYAAAEAVPLCHTVRFRPQRREDGHVGGEGERRVRVRILEQGGIRGERVEIGAGLPVIAVAGQVIGAKGIDGDQQHVGRVMEEPTRARGDGGEQAQEQGADALHCSCRAPV